MSIEASDALEAARFVAEFEPLPVETGYVKRYREMQERNPDALLREIRTMEKDLAMARAKESGVEKEAAAQKEEAQEDLGTDRCVELARRRLAEIRAKIKRKR